MKIKLFILNQGFYYLGFFGICIEFNLEVGRIRKEGCFKGVTVGIIKLFLVCIYYVYFKILVIYVYSEFENNY